MLTSQNVNTPSKSGTTRPPQKSKQQTLIERRNIRRGYRSLIQEAQSNRTDLVNPDSHGLLDLLNKGETLYTKVEMPREAALDSEFLSLASQYGLEQVQALKIALTSMDSLGFITRTKGILLDEDNDISSEGWTKLGNMVSKIYNTTPNFDFMYGPMEIEIPEKKTKAKKPKAQDEEIGKKVTAEKVENTNTAESESTSVGVEAMRSFIERKKKSNFLDTIVDKSSFARTVENIFYFSFLLKDGHTRLQNTQGTSVDDGIVSSTSIPPEEKDFKDGSAIPKHSIIKMDYETWRKLSGLTDSEFNIEKEVENLKRNSAQSGNSDTNTRPTKKSK